MTGPIGSTGEGGDAVEGLCDPLRVSGLDVDISVADSDCLARVPAASAVALMEEELTIMDTDTKKYFEAKFKQTCRYLDECPYPCLETLVETSLQ